ncbi:hypothetical protein BRDID11004_47730 [Bradyrhizobium diazoefficiens]|uniref:Uncharacterized protein n=1 Tax=Bradyrhizobium diazoefficiens TaxID=1355477 RepID=A0A809ZUS1_9BRAD|nr:hypothetical protein [Bradyrhizobium diazoefficiens]BBZ94324.1 hypothetical protein F07S3_41570 [Bradyrhizobium diazoefficiens]BCE56412.1 hypothetical protein XF5B_39240 [Bradyrhizobium diazoefficiens]
MSAIMEKRPDEVLDYVFDFARWLSTGDAITIATATVTSPPVNGAAGTAAVDHVTFDSLTATLWAKAGINGETAEFVVAITTALGRTKEAVLRLRIRN